MQWKGDAIRKMVRARCGRERGMGAHDLPRRRRLDVEFTRGPADEANAARAASGIPLVADLLHTCLLRPRNQQRTTSVARGSTRRRPEAMFQRGHARGIARCGGATNRVDVAARRSGGSKKQTIVRFRNVGGLLIGDSGGAFGGAGLGPHAPGWTVAPIEPDTSVGLGA